MTEQRELVRVGDLDPQALIRSAVESGANVETLERLVALAKDVHAQRARQAWYTAMATFQRTCPSIRKTDTAKIVSRRTGTSYSYRFAPLDEILGTILPIMGPLALSVSFRVRHEADQVFANCQISHEMGHTEGSGEVAMPVAQDDASGANAAQRVGIASTYAKRYALLAIIGLAPEDDVDAGEVDRGPSMPRSKEAPKAAPSTPTESSSQESPRQILWALLTAQAKSGKEVIAKLKELTGGKGGLSDLSDHEVDDLIARLRPKSEAPA